jgi:hypothetical protein
MELVEEIMNDVFRKIHIKGFPFDAVIHEFTEIDKGETPHDHPFSFTSHVLFGSYVETRYFINPDGSWCCKVFHRQEGDSFTVEADCIHKIIALPQGVCYTMIRPMQWNKEPGFYRFNDNGILYRQWNQDEFTPYKPALINE